MEINDFEGLWDRGSKDDVPPNHAIDLRNLAFTPKKDIVTRNGTMISFASGRQVHRAKIAAFDNTTLIVLTCDGNGNIYREDTGQVLYNMPGMVDFELINIFDKVIIAPILSSFNVNNFLMIWPGPSDTIRPVAQTKNASGVFSGYTDTTGLTVTEDTVAGVINAGAHCFTVAEVTDTGYTKIPGSDYACYSASGDMKAWLTQIPTGNANIKARWILMTLANQSEFFFVPNPDGSLNPTINDNTTNNLIINVPDTALVNSADSLLDQSPGIIVGGNSCGLYEYHGRLIVTNALAQNANNSADYIPVSSPVTGFAGGVESFDVAKGLIYVPTQNDGNIPRCTSDLFGGVLYIFKSVGIFATQDNGGDPSTWEVDIVDGSVGTYSKGLASITGSQNSLGISSVILLADREGLFLFNGNVMRPELSWKIKSTWTLCSDQSQIRLAVDPFANQIYIVLPTVNGNMFIVGDYSLGLDSQNIRWSVHDYSVHGTILDVMMANVNDGNDYNYWPRLGTPYGLYKLTPAAPDDSGTPITSYWQTSLLTPDSGSLNIFRYIRYRAKGSGNLTTQLYDESLSPVAFNTGASTNLVLSNGARDLAFQINMMNEKCAVRFTANKMTVGRFQLYGKPLFSQRPTV